MTQPSEPDPRQGFTRSQWLLLLILASVQFTHMVDFVVILPLATQLKKSALEGGLGISIRDFAFMVSAFGFAAGSAGLLFAPFLDRFDRKPTLLTLYAGFILGTLLCAVAPSYSWLVVGRVLAGAFGGTAASVVLAIVGDVFPPARRGTAMGVVMSAFSAATIVGVPLGLYLADGAGYGWRAPFYVLTVGSVVLLCGAVFALPGVRVHLTGAEAKTPFLAILTNPNHIRAYAFMAAVVFGSFSMIPYLAAFIELNVGRPRGDLIWVYVCGGLCTLLTMNVFGRLADRVPRPLLYRVLQTIAIVPVLALPLMPYGTPLAVVLVVTTSFMIFTSGRMVPAMAMVTAVCTPRQRGTFMSITAAMQQIGSGVAGIITANFIGGEEGQPIAHYEQVALLSAGVAVGCLFLASILRTAPSEAVSTDEVIAAAEAVP